MTIDARTLRGYAERIAAEELHRLRRRAGLDPAASKIVGQVLDELLARLLLARAECLATEDPEVLARVTELFADD